MPLSDLLAGFDDVGRKAPDDASSPTTGVAAKGRKRGRWKPPPTSAKWSDLYSTCGGGKRTSLQVAEEIIGTVRAGDRLHIVTDGWWAMEEPICIVAEQLGPCDFHMITWAINDDAVLRLAEAMRVGHVRHVRAVIDERMKVLRPAALDILQTAVGPGNLGIFACHAKAYVLRQVDGPMAVAMVGSANWTQNPRPESLVIDADPRAATVYASWVDDILDSGRAKPYHHSGKLASELYTQPGWTKPGNSKKKVVPDAGDDR